VPSTWFNHGAGISIEDTILRNRFLLFVPVLIALLATSVSAKALRVKWDSPTAGPGTDWSNAYTTVTAAIVVAATGNLGGRVVTVPTGLFGTSGIGQFTVRKGAAAATHGGGLYCQSASQKIYNCIFTGNTASGGKGGALYFISSAPTLTNVTVKWDLPPVFGPQVVS
jgi:hypothetical protein